MEAFTIILAALSLIFFVLDIILFFKLWGACDNIKRIADKYAPQPEAVRHEPSPKLNPARRKPSHPSWPEDKTPETKEDVERWLNEGE